MTRAAIYALTPQGARLAVKIALNFGGQIFLPAALAASPEQVAGLSPQVTGFNKLAEQLAANFNQFSCHILICAGGIAVRALAPLLAGKELDPAVLLLDQQGRFVVSLLSGHLGGANRLAGELAAAIGAAPVITTGTDSAGLPAIDELAASKKLNIINLEAVRHISAALLRGEKPALVDVFNRLELDGTAPAAFFTLLKDFKPLLETAENACPHRTAVLVDPPPDLPSVPGCQILIIESPRLWLGLGCKRGSQADAIENFIKKTLAANGFDAKELSGIASIDLKRDEPGLLEAAARLKLPLFFFSAAELDAVDCPNPSARVRAATGSAGVCEAAALLAASRARSLRPQERQEETPLYQETHSQLLLQKTKGNGMTLALAQSRFRTGKNSSGASRHG